MNIKYLLSYSWQDEDIVETIQNDWQTTPIEVLRSVSTSDSPSLKAIKLFLKRAKECDCIIVIISHSYLTSANALVELSHFITDTELTKKIIPLIAFGTASDKIDYDQYIFYWQSIFDHEDNKIKSKASIDFAINNDFNKLYANYDKHNLIKQHIHDIIYYIKNSNLIQWPDVRTNNYNSVFNYANYEEDVAYSEGVKIYQINDHEEREISLKRLLSKYPKSKALLRIEASLAYEEGKFRKARILLEDLLSKHPNFAEAYYDLAYLLHYNFNEYAGAIEFYKQAIHFSPKLHNAHFDLARLFHEHLTEYSSANLHYQEALALEPDNPVYNYHQAQLMNDHLHDYDGAKRHYEQVLKFLPDDVAALCKLAALLNDRFYDYKGARNYYEQVLSISPKNLIALQNLSILLTKVFQDYTTAQKYYNEILTITPDNEEAQSNLKILIRKMQEQTSIPASYFLSLHLVNVRSFANAIPINFTNNGRPSQWTIILGSNGVGKTTVLKSLAVMTPVEDSYRVDDKNDSTHIPIYASKWRPKWSPNRNQSRERAHISVTAQKGFKLKDNNDTSGNFTHNVSVSIAGMSYDSFKDDEIGLICYGYGAGRSIGTSALSDEQEPSDTCLSLFDDKANLMNPEEWFLQLDYRAKSENNNKSIWFQQLEAVKKVLKQVLPDITDIRVSPVGQPGQPKQGLELLGPYGWIRLSEMSLGYQILAVWLTDFASRLFVRYPFSDNPLAEPAIVLVDEIDLHLHPEWQRKLIGYLTDIFPNTQFIVTAHSPLVVQAASDAGANIVLLEREGDEVIVRNDLPSIEGWRLDQIVASDLFGQQTARSIITESWMQRRIDLASRESLSEEEKDELNTLNAKIHEQPLGTTEKERKQDDILRELARRLGKSDLLK
jgi:predicted ATP-binding protein involved in virulence/tetratricopeptide (TPR) repeat protein